MNTGIQSIKSGASDVGWLFTKQVQDHRNVMRCEVVQRANILSHWTQIQPSTADVVDVAKFAVFDDLAQSQHRCRMQEDMADEQNAVSFIGNPNQFFALLRRFGEWLFDKHMHVVF